MGKSDWFVIITGIIFLGAGSLMTALRKRVMRNGGVALIAVGAIGLVFWFGYYRNADAQQPPSVNGNCNNFGNYNVNCNTFNFGRMDRHLTDADKDWLLKNIPKDRSIRMGFLENNAPDARHLVDHV